MMPAIPAAQIYLQIITFAPEVRLKLVEPAEMLAVADKDFSTVETASSELGPEVKTLESVCNIAPFIADDFTNP